MDPLLSINLTLLSIGKILLVSFVTTVAVVIAAELMRPRRQSEFPENYLYENVFRLFENMDRLLEFTKECFESTLETRKSKSFTLSNFGLPTMVFTNSVENITHILKTKIENYGKGPVFSYRFKALLGEGIFNADGKAWYHHRKISSYLFNTKKFKTSVFETFKDHCDVLLSVLSKKARENQPIDIQSYMFKFTLDSIGHIAFGYDIGALMKDRVDFADAFDYCQEAVNLSFVDPFWMLKRFCTPSGWWYFVSLWKVNSFAYSLVRKRRREYNDAKAEAEKDEGRGVASEKRDCGDLLSLFLDREGEPAPDETDGDLKMKVLTDKFLRDVVLNFVIAGRDTTAQALSWSIYRLCIHPEQQTKIRQLVSDTLRAKQKEGETVDSRSLSFDDVQHMSYLEAFCMEVLRLHPSVPKEAKHAYENDTLPDGTPVKKGDLVVFVPWVMGRDPSLWDNPMTFKPERFIENPKPSPFVFTAFQAGPRTCLGQALAILEMKYVLSRLLADFKFTLAQNPDTVTYLNTITLPIAGGLFVNLHAAR